MGEAISVVIVGLDKEKKIHGSVMDFLGENYVGEELRGGIYNYTAFEWSKEKNLKKGFYLVQDTRDDSVFVVASSIRFGHHDVQYHSETILSFNINEEDKSVDFYDNEALEDGVPSLKVYRNGIFQIRR